MKRGESLDARGYVEYIFAVMYVARHGRDDRRHVRYDLAWCDASVNSKVASVDACTNAKLFRCRRRL